MKISIITVTYNSEKYLEDTIRSVILQDYKDIEYIIIDGGSSDNTLNIIQQYSSKISYYKSEPDLGIYDAMNKGIKAAKGNIIGFINSDDLFFNNSVVSRISNSFTGDLDCVFGDIVFVNSKNTNLITRKYSSKNFKLSYFEYGHMPPHPSFYAKKSAIERVGFYKTKYKIASDFDYLTRFLYLKKLKYKYLNIEFVKMRSGGVSSSIKNKILLNKEIYHSCIENKINTNYFKIYLKYLFKIFSYYL